MFDVTVPDQPVLETGCFFDYQQAMSATTEALIEEIRTAPEDVQREVLDYLVFLKTRPRGAGGENLLPLAQVAWAADWDKPEEDEAWRNL